jgi:hypothetical protein
MASRPEQKRTDLEDRRKGSPHILVTLEQLEFLADQASERTLTKIYAEIGQKVTRRAVLTIGASVVVLSAWMSDAVTINPSKLLAAVSAVEKK